MLQQYTDDKKRNVALTDVKIVMSAYMCVFI